MAGVVPDGGRDDGYAGRGELPGRAADVGAAARGWAGAAGFGCGGRIARFGCSGGALGGALPGSSIRRRMLGGTKRPAVDGFGAGGGGVFTGAGASGSAGEGGAASTTGGADASTTGASTGGSETTMGGGTTIGAISSTGAGSTNTGSGSGAFGAGGAGGRAVLISRGGGNDGAAGFAGSAEAAFFGPPAVFFAAFTAASEKMSPFGSSMPRWRASRSTNWRATISSSVLEALLSSIP